jgi:hypothetical protein
MSALPLNPFATFGGGLTGGQAGPSAAGGTTTSGFDSSGWAVNFGSGSAGANGGASLEGYLPYLLAGAGLLLLWRMTRKR